MRSTADVVEIKKGEDMKSQSTETKPSIVFCHGIDPVQSGLVSSLNRPGGNITGVSFAANLAEAKKLGLLHTVVPRATLIGVLMNPDNASVETQSRDLNEAARVLGLKLPFAFARNDGGNECASGGVRGRRPNDRACCDFGDE